VKFKTLLAVITLIIGLSEVVKAEMPSAKENQNVELEKITVTNGRASLDLNSVSENAAVISAGEIESLPSRNLSEALSYESGVDIQAREGFGRASSISIQGCDSRQVRVMIDGIPLNSQSSGQVNPAVFPVEDISRIEVIKGAASSSWGSSLGGVVNVITKDTGTTLIPKGSITSSFAENRTRKESFDLSGKAADIGYYLMSSYMESGGEGPKDDVLEKKAFSKLSYDFEEKGKVTTSFGYSGGDMNSGEYPDGTWQAQPYRVLYGKLGWEGNLENADIKLDLKHSRQEIVTDFYNSVADETPASRTEYRDRLYQLSLNTTFHPREKDLLVLGSDFDWDILSSTYLTRAKRLETQAPYASYTLKIDPWDFNSGLRYDNNSEFGEQLSPSAGAVYHFQNFPDTLIRANISRAFNAPPLIWKYYEESLSGLTTNPDIKPERGWVYELGLESKPSSIIWTKLLLYRADISDAIARAQNDAGKFYMKNFEKFRRQGAELEVKLNILAELNFSAAAAFNDIKNRATGQTVKGAGSPRQSFDLGLEYKNKPGFGFSLRGYYNRWNEEATVYTDQLGQDVSVDPNDRKMLYDLKIFRDFKNIYLFLNIYNLTNSKYWSDYYLPVHKRYFEAGITIKW
jgi:vitamin B12 transporter